MSFKSFLGWVILLGALAVPAVMFWNWWTKMQTTGTAEARRSSAAAAPFGAVSMMKGTVPAAQANSSGTVAGATPTAGLPAASATNQAQPPATAAAPQMTTPAASSGTASSPSTALAGKDSIEYNPASTRDPTLSPMDLKLLAKEALDREAARHQVKVAVEKPRINTRAIEDKLELQGIVATRNGIMALVNGERLREGDQIMGAVVKKITTRVVVFKYGGRTIMKRVE